MKESWVNLNLLFWLSLFPFVTGWMGENHFEKNPVAFYGVVLLMAAIAYRILIHFAIKSEGEDSTIGKAVGRDRKGNISVFIYLFAVLIAFFQPLVSIVLYILVALVWLIPDTRIERNLKQ